jgi:hypothetical protein
MKQKLTPKLSFQKQIVTVFNSFNKLRNPKHTGGSHNDTRDSENCY